MRVRGGSLDGLDMCEKRTLEKSILRGKVEGTAEL